MKAATILLISAAILGLGGLAVLVVLGFRHDSPTDRQLLDQGMVALQEGDRQKLVNLLHEFDARPAGDERELVESGVLLIDGDLEKALAKLQALEVDDSLINHRKLLTAVALLRLGRRDEASDRIEQVLVEEPSNAFALLGQRMLKDATAGMSPDERFVAQFKPSVERFCGDCHASPLPESFPKDRWVQEVAQGFGFYGLFDRHDLAPPDQSLVQKYYELQAPLALPTIAGSADQLTTDETLFKRHDGLISGLTNPGVAHVQWVDLGEPNNVTPNNVKSGNVLLVSEMRSGQVLAFDLSRGDDAPKVLAQLDHPCHTTVCDIDGDGDTDILVADLGSFYPEDHRKGRVVCLESDGQGGYDPIPLLDKVGRVSDVQPGDFDGDGDLDLVVAEFGWRTSGRVLYLENHQSGSSELDFRMRVIDPRHGTIHVPVIDLNQDGFSDFIALISQEHETIVAFLGDGKGNFESKTLYSANDPSYGSSGIQLVDLDQDGDQDILYTNGDTFDSDLLKPYHGVQWLENQGALQFQSHRLLDCYGAYRADAQDVDHDGDLDVMIVMALPVRVVDPERLRRTESIVCLVNDGDQHFSKRVIERGNCYHTTCDFADFDGDGDRDMVVGRLNVYEGEQKMPMIDVWVHQGTSAVAGD
ncbi:MAG: VCBS repeat-containing protein [Planctomycetales bacterium]|nr:VCBS repeat-containing protein [Planctomycetales bacterium]